MKIVIGSDVVVRARSTEFPVKSGVKIVIGSDVVVRARVKGASAKIEGEDKTASLYTALWDEGWHSSGPRYKSRTVSSFDDRRWHATMIDRAC